ncbi:MULTISPECIES: GNAT family N-acetyltransferase [unclassified Pseudofrankia]|uniref:GNAT family N-acetyltransferase n=1 Tax=unclassified Pseudofrankia TaxID=2994372 RepID=UPI0008DAB089|nr:MULTISPECIES: GNAT family N-acetyltransferase [unclassified Pseudofrankia]MDT3444313.1 N-acetyltransferase family protein [Pseudofrankia sp. BMG5.37]OHV43357.1 acetyltransferase [Pseudofrankia sp. BMG5.36]
MELIQRADAPPATESQIVIRPAVGRADAAIIREIYAPWILETAISFEEVVPSVDEMLGRMDARPRMPWLIAEVDGEPAGYAYACKHAARAAYRWSADVSVYLKAGQRGRGLGRRLYAQLIPQVRALGYVTLFAGVTHPNPASVGLHSAVGFELVGVHPNTGHKFGRWHDVGWYALSPAGDPPPAPAEPLEWDPSGPPSPEAATD